MQRCKFIGGACDGVLHEMPVEHVREGVVIEMTVRVWDVPTEERVERYGMRVWGIFEILTADNAEGSEI